VFRSRDGVVPLALALALALGASVRSEAAPVVLNEYNAVGDTRFLEEGGSDAFWGQRLGNGGDWFELVVVEDHVDLRGWRLIVSNSTGDLLNGETFLLEISDDSIWSDLRSGTVITIAEDLRSDVGDYEPAAGRWWIHARARHDDAALVSVTCITPTCAPADANWGVSNTDWQLTIETSSSQAVFGPAGEGIQPADGVGGGEVVKLEESPSVATTALSNYQDGQTSTFGRANQFEGGAAEQDLAGLRAVVPYSPLSTVRVNEVFAHSDPGIDWVELYNTSAETVDIGGWFLSDSFTSLTKYEIPEGTTIAPGAYLSLDESVLGFALSAPCGDEVILSEAVGGAPTGARDFLEFGPIDNGVSFGRWPDGDDDAFRLSAPSSAAENAAPRVGPIVVTEIMYNPLVTDPAVTVTPEFVELRNVTNAPVALSTAFDGFGVFPWRLSGGIDFDFAPGTVIPAQAHLVAVLFDPAADTAALAQFRSFYGLDETVDVVGPYQGRLDNFSDRVRVSAPDTPEPNGDICGGSGDPSPLVPQVVVDELEYFDFAPWPPEADGSGASLVRVDTSAPAEDPENWAAGTPTPGRGGTNSTTTTTLVQPECNDDPDCDDGIPCTTGHQCTDGVCVAGSQCDLQCNHCSGDACVSSCGVPASGGGSPTAVDALFMIRSAVGLIACAPCVCDVDGSGTVNVSDALRTLQRAVGIDIELSCIP
jgi:hypothetical protein